MSRNEWLSAEYEAARMMQIELGPEVIPRKALPEACKRDHDSRVEPSVLQANRACKWTQFRAYCIRYGLCIQNRVHNRNVCIYFLA